MPRSLLSSLLALLASCGSGAIDPGEPLYLVNVLPRPGAEPILLNDDLRLEFSEVVEPASITENSVRLVEASSGREVEGGWVIDGREMHFRPRGPRQPSLDDGGFQPGARYVLELKGFPSLSGPRAFGGAGLAQSIRHEFRTVDGSGAAGGSGEGPPVLLRDASPDQASLLRLRPGDVGSSRATPLPWDQALILACDEPLDPRGLEPSDFEVRRVRDGAHAHQFVPLPGGALDAPLGVASLELIRNEDEDALDPAVGAAALLRVTFKRRLPLEDGELAYFELGPRSDQSSRPSHPAGRPPGGLRDFSGRSVYPGPIRFFAARDDSFRAERRDVYEFDFLDSQDFAPFLDPASDGTAHWSDTGRLEIRYPAAAGNGADGRVELEGDVTRVDYHGTRLVIPKGKAASLTGQGLVVLRSQGRVDLDGVLIRELAEGQVVEPMWDPAALRSLSGLETLSDWLAAAAERDAPWTVVIAGGDLVVKGEIRVETPLLLVAGGMIRGSGRPGAAPAQIWLLGEGGFTSMPYLSEGSASGNITPPLVIDEPLFNPLVEPLTFVAISSVVPKGVAPEAWGTPLVSGHAGARGSFLVQYLRAEMAKGPSAGTWEDLLGQAVRYFSPMEVVPHDGQGARVRLRMELRVSPGPGPREPGPWDPPFVDRVRLTWRPEPR